MQAGVLATVDGLGLRVQQDTNHHALLCMSMHFCGMRRKPMGMRVVAGSLQHASAYIHACLMCGGAPRWSGWALAPAMQSRGSPSRSRTHAEPRSGFCSERSRCPAGLCEQASSVDQSIVWCLDPEMKLGMKHMRTTMYNLQPTVQACKPTRRTSWAHSICCKVL